MKKLKDQRNISTYNQRSKQQETVSYVTDSRIKEDVWLPLPLENSQETFETLHLWTQIVGKIRLAQSPMVNHWWQVPFYLTSRGLTTSPIPYGMATFQIDFDFLDHQLIISADDGNIKSIALASRSVADFYHELFNTLQSLGFNIKIWTLPVEVQDPIPFDKDYKHSSYPKDTIYCFWKILLQVKKVFEEFRSIYIGKCSPVHFFWGSFDLAVTRFSGRRAPEHPGGIPNLSDWVVREAYSHECSSCGFWPGFGSDTGAAFYSYAYPEPKGFKEYNIKTNGAFYNNKLLEFILPYDSFRKMKDPDKVLMQFLQETYEAGANFGKWNRYELERTEYLSYSTPENRDAPTFPAPSREGSE